MALTHSVTTARTQLAVHACRNEVLGVTAAALDNVDVVVRSSSLMLLLQEGEFDWDKPTQTRLLAMYFYGCVSPRGFVVIRRRVN